MKKVLYFLIIILLICSIPAFSKEEVKFDAQNLRFSFSSGLLIGKGNVVFSYRNLKLYADYAEIDINNKNIFAKGNVKIFIFKKKGKSEEIVGKAAYYDWNENFFFMDDMRIHISGGKLKGTVYIKGETLEYKDEKGGEKIKIIDGKLTTCTSSPPAYYFDAQKIMVIPGKRIYAWNVTWYEGKNRILTYPYFIIFLDRPYQLPYVPKVGYSKSDGWYIKNSFNYFVNPDSWGTFSLDWYSKKGIGYGVKHEWDSDNLDTTLHLYYFKYKSNANRDFKADLTLSDWSLGNFDGKLTLSYNTSGNIEYTTKKINTTLYLKGNKKLPLELKITYTGSGESITDNEKFKGALLYKDKFFNEKLGVDLSLKYTNSISSSGSSPTLNGALKLSYGNHSLSYFYKGSKNALTNNIQKFRYDYKYAFSKEIKNKLTLYYEEKNKIDYKYADTYMKAEHTTTYKDLSIVFSKYFDTDGPFFQGDENFNFVEKLPEIKYAPSTKNLGKTSLKYKYTLIAGNYNDLKNDLNAQRYGATLSLQSSIKMGDFNFTYILDGGKYTYSTGDYLGYYGGELKLKGNIAPKITMETTYKQKEVDGKTPFSFDNISPAKNLSVSFKSRMDTLKFSITGGYDYIGKKYKKLVGSIAYEPNSSFKSSFKFGYDLNKGKWTKLTGNINTKLGKNWKISYSATLSSDDMKIINNKVVLTYVLPCERELSISYDQKKEEYWLEYNILAFPSPIISIGTGK